MNKHLKEVNHDIEREKEVKELKRLLDKVLNERIGEPPEDDDGNAETVHFRLGKLEESAKNFSGDIIKVREELATIKGGLAFIGIFLGLIVTLLFFILGRL